MKHHLRQIQPQLAGTPAEGIAAVALTLAEQDRAGALLLKPLELGLIARALGIETSKDGHRHWITLPTQMGGIVLECNLLAP
jgi:hypothetical protein